MVYRFRRKGDKQLAEPVPGKAPEGAVEGPPFPEHDGALTMEEFYEQRKARPDGLSIYVYTIPGYFSSATGEWVEPRVVNDWVLFGRDKYGRVWPMYKYGFKDPELLVIASPLDHASVGSEHPRGTL